MEYQKLMLEKQDRVCLVKINHPEALNALNTVILQELDRAFDEIAADPETDVVILTGEGRSFVAGADIAEMSVMKAEEGRRFGELGAAVFRKIELMANKYLIMHLCRSQPAFDHFHQFHSRNRIEEMHTDHLFRTVSHSGHFRYRKRRSIGCQYRFRFTNSVQQF